MKVFIISVVMVIICLTFEVYQQDYDLHQRHLYDLKYYAEEAAAAAAQYYDHQEYSTGNFIFNQAEGIKAAEYVMKKDLNLNDDFSQKAGNYWRDTVTYTIQFYDDDDIPATYTDPIINYSVQITQPTVVVAINCGQARYRVPFIQLIPTSRRIAAHEWKGR